MTRFFMRDFDGTDRLLGVWVWDDANPAQEPEIVYPHPPDRLEAENILADLPPGEGQTWRDVMQYHVDKAHWQYRRRQGVFETEMYAGDLFAATQAELAAGKSLGELSGVPPT